MPHRNNSFGLPVAHTEIVRFGAHKVLSVERFDRTLHRDGGWLLRLPQEDFCQALGVPPHLKHESQGGPGVPDLVGLLRHSETAREDLDTLFAALVVFWMLAAPDGHAKNFSLRLLPGGRFRLTPLYDVMSIRPVEGDGGNPWSWHKAKLAMAVHGKRKHYAMRDMTRRHFTAMTEYCLLGDIATPIVERLVATTPHVIESVGSCAASRFSGEGSGAHPGWIAVRRATARRNAAGVNRTPARLAGVRRIGMRLFQFERISDPNRLRRIVIVRCMSRSCRHVWHPDRARSYFRIHRT